MANLESIKADEGALRAMLERAGVTAWRGRACKCPFHDDGHASAGIFGDDKGRWRFKCQACGVSGDIFDIQARIEGKPLEDVLRSYQDQPNTRRDIPRQKPKVWKKQELAARFGEPGRFVWSYIDPATGKTDLITGRVDHAGGGKHFEQYMSDGNGGFIAGAPAGPRPLYNRGGIKAADRVVVVEGERKVHALVSLGIQATCSPQGALSAHLADWSPQAGKSVIIWPDNDDNGLKYADAVRGELDKLPSRPSVRQIDPAGLGLCPKGDAVDFIASLYDLPVEAQRRAVEEVLADAADMGVGAEWREIWEATLDGRRRALPVGMTYMQRGTQALLPGTITLLCGAGGASKSLLIVQWARHWFEQEIPFVVYELEGERAEHLQRAAAQITQDSRILDSEWAEANPARIREIMDEYADYMAKFGACLTAAPDTSPTLDDLAEWVAVQAKGGKQIIVIDPVTAATPSGKPWIADAEFILKVKITIRETGARLILVMHPKKGHVGGGLDDLAGGAVYARLANTVLWLDVHEPPKDLLVKCALGENIFSANRTISVIKARHGRGGGHKIAMRFDGQSVSYTEYGLVLPKKKERAE